MLAKTAKASLPKGKRQNQMCREKQSREHTAPEREEQGLLRVLAPREAWPFCGLLLHLAHKSPSWLKRAQVGFILRHKSSLTKTVIKTQHYLDVE